MIAGWADEFLFIGYLDSPDRGRSKPRGQDLDPFPPSKQNIFRAQGKGRYSSFRMCQCGLREIEGLGGILKFCIHIVQP